MTYREICSALWQIDKSEYRRAKWDAALRGIKLPELPGTAPKTEFTEQEEEVLAKQMKAAMARKSQARAQDG